MSWLKRLGLLSAVLAVGAVALIVGLRSDKTDQSGASVATQRAVSEANPAGKPGQAQVKAGATVAKSAAKKGYVLKRTGAAAKADDGKNTVAASDPGRLISPSESIAMAGLPVPGDSNMMKKPWSKKNQEWPDPGKGTAEGTVIDYRVSQLSPSKKGGEFGERHEWLVEPTEGYTYHVEEDYYPNEAGEAQLVASSQYVANQVMLTVPAEVPFEDFRAQMRQVGVVVKDPLMEVEKGAKIVAVMVPEVSFSAVQEIQDAIRKFDANLKPEKDFVNTVGLIPNEPNFDGSLWGMKQIKAPEAWNIRTTADNSVRIAVVDTGILKTHEDLASNIEGSGFRSIGGTTSNDGTDDNGHGTHCAGTIAGVGNNGKGVAGVLWGAKVRAYKFLNSSGSGCNSDAIACFGQIRRDKGSNQKWVVSCSWGGVCRDSSLESAINALRSDGIIVVCAAGNDGTNNDTTPHYPASYACDNIVAVASTGSGDALSSFSCYGTNSVDIAAPGESIYSTYYNSNSSYASLNGTSMATPHVSGALALIWSQFPNETYSQIIQRLYNAGDAVAALNGKCATGKRLNVYNAVVGTVLPAPSPVTASQGTYADRIDVSWPMVSGATHYELSYATSATGTKTVLQNWGSANSFTHSGLAANVTYYYFVRAAANASGARASDYSVAVSGYTQSLLQDEWDPADDTPTGGTSLVPAADEDIHGPHTLATTDLYDWFKIDMQAGETYSFATVENEDDTYGRLDTYGELFNAPSTNVANRVAYNDDCGGDFNFSFTYTPTNTATYYLRVRAYCVGSRGTYQLQYSVSHDGDEWDPADDVRTGATEISPSAAEQTHGEHSMSLTDTADWFKIVMEANHAYTFVSDSETDMTATLYNDDGTQVAYSDDDNGYPNFRLVYTPTQAGTYYLKVATWARPRVGTYNLLYSSEVVSHTYEIGYVTRMGWDGSLFISKRADNPVPASEFAPTDTLYVCYSWKEKSSPAQAIIESVTNTLSLVDATGRETWWANNWWPNGLTAGSTGYSVIPLTNPGRGSYTMKVDLNQNYDGDHSVNEYSYTNNHSEVTFTIVNPAPTLDSIRIDGNDTVASKATAQYTCTATFSDGTTQSVTPVWLVNCAADVATIDGSGVLTAGEVDHDTEITVTATYTYNGTSYTATKRVIVTYVAPVVTAPFPAPTIRNPAPPWVIRGPVRINGVPAERGDVLAAYVGDECRGTGVIDENGDVAMGVYLDGIDELIKFKVWDRSSGDEGEVLNVMQMIIRRVIGNGQKIDWTPEDEPPAEFDACSRDPYGDPVIGPSAPTILYAKATINGHPASAGDLLVAIDKDTDEVVGKQVLRFRSNGAQDGGPCDEGMAFCMMVMYLGTDKTNLVFRVWDVSEDKICHTRKHFKMEAKVGEILPKNRGANDYVQIDTTDDTIVEVELQPGWTPISLNVAPSNAAPASVFEELVPKIAYVTAPQGRNGTLVSGYAGMCVTNSAGVLYSSDLFRIGLGLGYWVSTDPNGAPISIDIEGASDPSTTLHVEQGWNLIGYTLPRGGRVADVLRGALGSSKIDRVMYGSAVYPNGNLTMLEPGVAYWMYSESAFDFQYNAAGMMNLTACAEASSDQHDCGGFGKDNEGITYDLEKSGAENATILENVTVTLFDKPARMGDCIAVYGTGANVDKCYAKAKVGDTGTVSMSVFAAAGTELAFKIWNSAGDQIFACDAANTFTAAPNTTLTGLTANAAGTTPTYTVTFVLDGFADRTGGGELEQTIAFGENATFPEIAAKEGFTFAFWEYVSVDDIRQDLVVHAYFNGAISFDANGGTGTMAPVTASGLAPVVLPANAFTRENWTFAGWSTNANGAVVYADCAEIAKEVSVTIPVLYAVWNGSIKLDANGGEGEMDSIAITSGKDVVLPACTFTSKDHAFLGWATSDDGEVVYEDKATIPAAEAEKISVLYAVWDGDVPVPPTKDPVLIKDPTAGKVKDGISYTGWLKNGSTFTVKISKAKNGSAKATMTIQPVTGKKSTLKGTINMETGKGEGGLAGLTFGEKGVSGEILNAAVVGAIGAGKKGDPVLTALDAFKGKIGAIALDTPAGVATMTFTFSTKGKVKVAGTLGDGTKVSVSSQATLGDKQVAVPVVFNKKTAQFAFVVWFDATTFMTQLVNELPKDWMQKAVGTAGGIDTGAHVFSVVKKDVLALVAGALEPLLPEQEAFTVSDKQKFVFDKACKVDKVTGEAQGDKKNPAAVKITYTAKKGTMKGSFGVWTMVNGKAKKTSVTVTGVVINGTGYGTGVIKKVTGSIPVSVK